MSSGTMRCTWRGASKLAVIGLLVSVLAPAAGAEDGVEARRSPVVRVVEQARPSVVSIHTTQVIRRNLYGGMFELPPVEGKGIGSGAIFHPEGYVITNAHVISRASKVLVDVTENEDTVTHEARIFAVDVPHDLAILRLLPAEGGRPRRYPFLPLPASDDLMIGETVVAIGNPFGIGITVTTGVLGGLNRTVRLSNEAFDDFLQIDAAINPGNSGGPLFDVTGRWIGVNTAIWNRTNATAEGIGFAIPVRRVRELVAHAFKRRIIRGDWLGVELTEDEQGQAIVRHVFPKGPGQEAGLQPDDQVVSVEQYETPSLFDLRWRMAFLPQGATVRLGIVRNGMRLSRPLAVPLRIVPTDALSYAALGFVASDVSQEDNQNQSLAFDAGVVVKEVRDGGPASRIKMVPGDVVVGLGTRRIRHSDDLLIFLQYVQPGDIVDVHIRRKIPIPGGRGRVTEELQKGRMVAE